MELDLSRYFDIEEMFCGLFTLCGEYGIKKNIFTHVLMKTHFVKCIEKGDYRHAYDESVTDIFNQMTDFHLELHETLNVYNEYHWVGKAYYYLQNVTHKSFGYIFLKLPFETLFNMFNPYHEMDMSQLLQVFQQEEKKTTILKELCRIRKLSIAELSKDTGIPISTLTKYKKNDDYLFKASFKYIYILSSYFSVPETLFLDQIPLITQ